MQIGVVFPQTEIGAAAAGVRAYASRVEALGFAHVLAYDHVLGADPEVHAPWTGPYNLHTTFHEPFVLFGYLAACTRLERCRVRGARRDVRGSRTADVGTDPAASPTLD